MSESSNEDGKDEKSSKKLKPLLLRKNKVKTLLIFLTFNTLFFSCSTVLAQEQVDRAASVKAVDPRAFINLPNGEYYSSNKKMQIFKNTARIEISSSEVVELELQPGIGATMPGNYLYMDSDNGEAQIILGNCKQLEKITCYFAVTEPETMSDGKLSEGRNIVYEIVITESTGFLSMTLNKFREVQHQDREPLDSFAEDFYLTEVPQSDNVENSRLR